MKQLIPAGMLALVLAMAGCSSTATESPAPTQGSSSSVAPSATPAASGCSAGGLDAMTALSEFQLEMDAAQKAGKLTLDQLIAARDRLFNETEAAADKEDWTAYCASIDNVRTELGL